MSKPDTWMPFYIGDYFSDTMHLSTEQHGAYLLLLLTAWNRGGRLPCDETQLAFIARCDKKAWARVRVAVLPFFTRDGDSLIQGRLMSEYEKASEVYETKKVNGSKGGRPKTETKPAGYPGALPAGKPDANREANPSGKRTETQSQSQSHTTTTTQNQKPNPVVSESGKIPARARSTAPKPAAGAALARSRIDENFHPDPGNKRESIKLGLDLDSEKQRFVAHYTATADQRADWQAQFRKWLLDSALRKVDGKPAGVNGSPGPPWWTTNESMLAEGAKVGIQPLPGEEWQQFRGRIQAKQARG